MLFRYFFPKGNLSPLDKTQDGGVVGMLESAIFIFTGNLLFVNRISILE